MVDTLTDQVKDQYRQAYNIFLRSQQKKINAANLKQVLIALGSSPTQQQINDMIKQVDINNNGQIEFEQFLQMMARKISHNNQAESVQQAFKIFDKDGDGMVDYNDLSEMFKSFNFPIKDEQIQAMIKEADFAADGKTGKISYQKFYKVITQR